MVTWTLLDEVEICSKFVFVVCIAVNQLGWITVLPSPDISGQPCKQGSVHFVVCQVCHIVV